MTEQPTPVAAIPLEYAGRAADPWRFVGTAVAVAALAQGAAMGLSDAWTMLGSWAYRYSFWSAMPLSIVALVLVGLARLAVAVTLVAGGGLTLRRRPAGPAWVTIGEQAYVALLLLTMPMMAWRMYEQLGMRGGGRIYTLNSVANLPAGLVLPLLVWALCRRPEVRAGMDNGY